MLYSMTGMAIKQSPDISGCSHSGLDGPIRRVANWDVGYCLDCKFNIAFRLDESGKRTGETQIVELVPA